ncbi:MAG: hypothetical protein ACPKQO_06685 [Nitrososphaeraceae archaeon]
MNLIYTFIINTISALSIISIVIFFLVVLNENKLKLDTNKDAFKLKFRRILELTSIPIFYFSLFIHLGIFLLINLKSDKYPGLSLDLNLVSICVLFISIIILSVLFLISIPNLISLTQFLTYEFGRSLLFNEEERSILVYYKGQNKLIKHKEILNIEFHIKKIIVRGDEELNYIIINLDDNSNIIITDLVIDVENDNSIKSIYTGIKKSSEERIFNKINMANKS